MKYLIEFIFTLGAIKSGGKYFGPILLPFPLIIEFEEPDDVMCEFFDPTVNT